MQGEISDGSGVGQTVCIILARGGSKGIPGKNLRPVGGVSLIGRSVRAAVSAPSVTLTCVSTDDAAIAAEASRHGARIIQRPADISGDKATSESGWLHALDLLEAEGMQVDRLVFLQCTSPFTTGADIEQCLAVMQDQGADCALSVISDHSFLWTYADDGFGKGVNHNEAEQRKRRQDLPPAFRESGAIYTVRRDAFRAKGQRFCGKVALCPVDHPAVEIDSLEDLAVCSAIAATRPSAPIPQDRLRALRVLVMDFDGVHTDNLVSTDAEGREAVVTSRGDGMGLSMLAATGHWSLLILSKERNPVVLRRAEKLKIEVMNAVDDKVAALDAWLKDRGASWDEVLYVGNDLNDVAIMSKAALAACPSDAHPSALAAAEWVLPAPGGRGALRSLCDRLLETR